MVKNDMVMTDLERELSEIFAKIGLNFRERRYYDEILLSGYACKMIDDLHEYSDEDIERIAHAIAKDGIEGNILQGIEYKMIYHIVKSGLHYRNCQSQDEHDYENEIDDNAVGGFGIYIPLSERIFCNRGFAVYYAFYPDFSTEEFKEKQKFDAMRPIKDKMNDIIGKGIYKESIVIKFDSAIRKILENDQDYRSKIPDRTSLLPELMIHKKENYYKVELNPDFQHVMDEFDAIDAWELNDEQFRQIFPLWCNPVRKDEIKRIYNIFSEFVLKNNNCRSTEELAKAICTLIHSY